MLSTLSIGMLVGGVAKDIKQASVIASILYFPMLIFSGTTLPVEVMPPVMQRIVSFFPLTQGITMMKNAFLGVGAGSVLTPVCVMLGLTALCAVRLSKKWLYHFFEKASLRSAPLLSADSGQFDAHSAQSVFCHAHVAAENI